jgi:hypothetical protein
MNLENMKAVEEKMRAQTAAEYAGQAQCGQAIGGAIGGCTTDTVGSCRSSLREEAERQVGYHRVQADRQDRAAAFFREHPEFDEFIQLIRSGVIGI